MPVGNVEFCLETMEVAVKRSKMGHKANNRITQVVVKFTPFIFETVLAVSLNWV